MHTEAAAKTVGTVAALTGVSVRTVIMSCNRSACRRSSAEEQVEIFGATAFTDEYAAEAEQVWGDTDAWRQSQQRAAAYTMQDWQQIKADGDELLLRFVEAKRDGVRPGSERANELARQHRTSIERFYDCSAEMHTCLAEMYLADERFTRHYDDSEPGLARFVRDVIVAAYSAA